MLQGRGREKLLINNCLVIFDTVSESIRVLEGDIRLLRAVYK